MKLCLYGVVVSFEILEAFFLSPGRYSANNAHDIQNNLDKLFLLTVKGFAMPKPSTSSKDFKLLKFAKHFLSFQELFFMFLMISEYNIYKLNVIVILVINIFSIRVILRI